MKSGCENGFCHGHEKKQIPKTDVSSPFELSVATSFLVICRRLSHDLIVGCYIPVRSLSPSLTTQLIATIPRPVRNCAFQVFRCAPPIVGTAPCGCPSRTIGISHGTAQGLSLQTHKIIPNYCQELTQFSPMPSIQTELRKSYMYNS